MRIYATGRYYEELLKNCDDHYTIKGIEGEREVFHYLKPLSPNKYKGFIIPNYKFIYGDENVECDFLVVTKNSVIILEVKNWQNPVSISNLGEVQTSDNQTRGNIEAQISRQKEFLEDTLKRDLNVEIKVQTIVLFSNVDRHRINPLIDITDYSSVVPKINQIIENNNQIVFDLGILHDYFIKNNKNLNFNCDYYLKGRYKNGSRDFLNVEEVKEEAKKTNDNGLIKANLENYDKFYYLTRKDKKREFGYCVSIPQGHCFVSENIDYRGFALLYNLFIRGDGFFIPKGFKDELSELKIKLEVHYFIIVALLEIQKGNFTFDGKSISVPICCDNADIVNYAQRIIEYWLDLFATISNVSNYKIFFDESSNKVIFNSYSGSHNSIFVNTLDSKIENYSSEIWSNETITYSIENNIDAFNEIVEVLFGFVSYREGQYECIQNVFNNNRNQIIMLPTGQGKSMIFYLLLLLQPKTGIIVYPTRLLIIDQISKLDEFGIININNFGNNKKINGAHIQMLIPEDILEKTVLENFINMNQKYSVSYLILDEVHCLSKFSHDFRPEYFLMHDKINYYLDKATVKGFTATATWEVLEDLKHQFGMTSNSIYSPNLLRRNVKYVIKEVNSSNHMDEFRNDIVLSRNKYVGENDKILVFTNEIEEINEIKRKLNLSNIIYTTSQKDFTSNELDNFRYADDDVLVSLSDVGIGVDIPEVNTIIHYSQPLSIADLAQHTGRGGRADYSCTSILYYDKSEILARDKTEKIGTLVNEIYNSLLTNREKKYNWAEIYIGNHDVNELKFTFFCFYQLGIISEWWRESEDSFGLGINHEFDMDFQQIRRYVLREMGNERSLMQNIKNAQGIVELVNRYYEWFNEWKNAFKMNSYSIMKNLLERILIDQLDDNEIQQIIKSETYYSNVELVAIDKIKAMSFDEIVDFADKNIYVLSTYQKYLNSTDPKMIFLSIIKDIVSNDDVSVVIKKFNLLLSMLTNNEKISLVRSLFKSQYIVLNDGFIKDVYCNFYKKCNFNDKIQIFERIEQSSIQDNYKYLFLFSIINCNSREAAHG